MVNENTTEQIKKTGGPGGAMFFEKFDALSKRYNENFANCEQLHFDQYLDFFGLKIKIKFDINGWIDNKCEIKAFANVPAIGKDIRQVFEVKATDEQIAAIKPEVECHFTKDQLKIVIDAVVARSAQNEAALKKMMESPEKALETKRQMTPEEEKLVAMLMTENACKIPNKDELMKQFMDLTTPKAE